MTAGIASKGWIVGSDDGRATWHMGCLFDWKATAAETGGAFSLVDVRAPRGAEPPLHVHEREDELFTVLEGHIAFEVGGELLEAGPGDHIWAPRRVPHRFAFRTPEIAMRILITPAGQEDVFLEFSEPAPSRTLPPWDPATFPDEEAMMARDADYGVTYLGGPLVLEGS